MCRGSLRGRGVCSSKALLYLVFCIFGLEGREDVLKILFEGMYNVRRSWYWEVWCLEMIILMLHLRMRLHKLRFPSGRSCLSCPLLLLSVGRPLPPCLKLNSGDSAGKDLEDSIRSMSSSSPPGRGAADKMTPATATRGFEVSEKQQREVSTGKQADVVAVGVDSPPKGSKSGSGTGSGSDEGSGKGGGEEQVSRRTGAISDKW